ncbi:MAG: hypothetical protein ACFHVJ_05400 [Aestuariibacter sp.]
MKSKHWILITLLGMATPTFASNDQTKDAPEQLDEQITHTQLQDTIERAITQFENTPREQWSYRISRYESEEDEISRRVEQFTPGTETSERWSLLSINGAPPTEEQAREFVASKLKKAKENNGRSFSIFLRELIQVETLQLQEVTKEVIRAEFQVYLSKLGEDVSESLRGTLLFNREQQFIDSIQITNKQAISPVFGADIDEFKLTFRFLKMNNSVLPLEHQLQMRGTWALFKEIREVSTDTFSHYQYIGE